MLSRTFKTPSRTVLLLAPALLLVILFSSYIYSPARLWSPAPPAPVEVKRAIVLPTVDVDSIKWTSSELIRDFNFQAFVYCMGSNTTRPECHLPRTKNGNEAGAYISFVLDYYEDLPDYTLFLHDGHQQWHNDVSGPYQDLMIPHIRYQAVDAMGYVNLRCTHSPGCTDTITPFDVEEEQLKMNSTKARFLDLYQLWFGVQTVDVPKRVANVCCAQFAVTRRQILKRPKSDYERLLKWLVEAESDSSHSKGWAFEKIWHIIFSMDAVFCPRAEQCRCDVYGWCGPLTTGEVLTPIGSRW